MKKIFLLLILFSLSITLSAQQADFPFDENARIDPAVNNKVMFGYYIMLFDGNPMVYFRNPDDLSRNLAYYNWQQQFWVFRAEDFNSGAVNLRALFLQIDLTKTQLDRNRPQAGSQIVNTEEAEKPYDYSGDKDFSDFMQYLTRNKANNARVDFFLKAAANPAKRGNIYDFVYGAVLDVNKVGIQYENMKSVKYKNIVNGTELQKTGLKTAGGMQYYFELAKGNYIRTTDNAWNIFKDNKAVPVTIVELEPMEGVSTKGILRGKALVKQVDKDLATFFGKKFTVTSKVMKLNYQEFGNNGEKTPLAHADSYLAEHVNPQIDKNSLIIYYFTNKDKLAAIDDEMTHPLTYGPYGTDWQNLFHNIIHELGHSLGLRHHFVDTDGSADLGTHISDSCVMNYKYAESRFCSLCRYAMGIGK